MIQKICPSIPARSLVAALLIGVTGCTPSQKNDTTPADNQITAEVMSEPTAEAYRAIFEAENNLNLVKYDDSNEYDFYNRPIKEREYDENGNLYCYHLYEYDTEGHLIQDMTCRPDGSLLESYTCEYLDNGVKKETTIYSDKQKVVCSRDSQDLIHQYNVYNPDGSLCRQHIFAYAPDGVTQRELIYDGQGRVIADYLYN